MALTGEEVGRYFDQKISQEYTGFIDAVKKNRIFRDALIGTLERKYLEDSNTKIKDESTFLNKSNVPFSLNNNQIHTAPIQISKYTVLGTVGTFTTALPHNLITGDKAVILGVVGETDGFVSPDGTRPVTVTGPSTFTAAVTNGLNNHTASTGTITTTNTSGAKTLISDYWHLATIKTIFNNLETKVSVKGLSNASPIVLELDTYNDYRTGEKINISGSTGNTAANGDFFIKKINQFKAELYTDAKFQTASAGDGAYLGGAILSRVIERHCVPYESDVKIGLLNTPTVTDPAYEIADNFIKIYPQDEVCNSVVVDYVSFPSIFVDVKDTVTDLTLYYPEKLLYLVIDHATVIAAQQISDNQLFQEGLASVNQND